MKEQPLKIGVVGVRGLPDVPGGAETHCAELYPRLAAAGTEVTVYGRARYLRGSRTWRGVRVVALPSPRGRGLEAAIHTLLAILAARKDGCKVVHVHSVGPGLMLPLARFLGMRTVFTVHSPDYRQRKWGRLARTYLRLGELLGSVLAHQVVTVSEHQQASLERKYRRDVHLLPNGAPVPLGYSRGRLLASLGVVAGNYIVFVGRLVPDKRVEDLMAAAAASRYSPQVVVVGDSADSDDYADFLRREAGPRVVFAGWRSGEELAELYANARLFVLPSAVEGLPIALLEALAYGVPSIASDIEGAREVLDGGRAGRLVPVGDVPALTRVIDSLWTDAAGRLALAAAGRRRVREKYDWDRIAAGTLAVVRTAAGRRCGADQGGRRRGAACAGRGQGAA